ncbi:hypothetical protein MauCBS54593_007937 [Microsporum audouinii]
MFETLAITAVHWAFSSLLIVDRLIEPQTTVHFLEFCASGNLPNGKVTKLPLLGEDEFPQWNRPYNEWAPDPYNLSEDLMSQISLRIGSAEDFSRLEVVAYNVHSWKSTFWDDMVPISPTQWQAKGLDKPENFGLACEYLSAAIAVFEYLNVEKIQKNLKETYNLLYDDFSYFDKAINSQRSSAGITETISMAALWEEYIRTHYQTITTRAHSWVISHIEELRGPILRDRAMHKPPSEDTYSPEQWTLTNKLHLLAELTVTSDFTILIPMDGYKGYSAPDLVEDIRSPSFDIRRKAAAATVKSLTNFNIVREIALSLNSTRLGTANPESILQTLNCQIAAQTQVRHMIRGNPEPLPPPAWIMRIQKLMDSAKSTEEDPEPYKPPKFTMYKLVYGKTDEEWNTFMQKLEADMNNWGDGIDGANQIKGLLKLEWFDGEELGIPEDDVDAAAKHFEKMREAEDFSQRNLLDYDLLVIDNAAFSSYMTDKFSMPSADNSGLHPSDFQPFVLQVSSDYDPEDPDLRKDELPGWKGRMRVLGSLVWSDIYASASEQSSTHMWRWAMDHPNQVYTGRTVPMQVKAWEEYNSLYAKLWRGSREFAKDLWERWGLNSADEL